MKNVMPKKKKDFFFFWLNTCFSNLAILYGLCILDISFSLLAVTIRGRVLISIAHCAFFISTAIPQPVQV